MVMAQQMNKTMDQQGGQMVVEGDAPINCLLMGRVNGNDDIAEHGVLIKIIIKALGKGEDIGGLILLAPLPVYFLHGRIIKEQQGEFVAFQPSQAKKFFGPFDKEVKADMAGAAVPIAQQNGHNQGPFFFLAAAFFSEAS